MKKVIVIGGGAAGMMAAYTAASMGKKVILVEQNEKLGKKLFITGKGRCNITNASDMDTLFSNVMSNRKFLYSAFYAFDNERVIDFFESHGLQTKTERGNRVFPVSDHSSDVIQILRKALLEAGVKIMLHTKVKRILMGEQNEEKRITGISLENGEKLNADALIVATGGFSYPSTGSTGDGYRFAQECGHKIVNYTPSLVPFEIKEKWVKEVQGLALRNVKISVYNKGKKLYEDFGEMLFTHFGVSGPLILSASGMIRAEYFQSELELFIDLKPALDEEQLDRRILRDFEAEKNRQFKNSLGRLFPSGLIPVMIEKSGIDPGKKINEISKKDRQNLVQMTKHLPMTITGLRDWKEAIITKGGVSVKEVNPSTMESKLVSGLFFCGEVLDLDALTGGYNLQIAWSTGYLAGISV